MTPDEHQRLRELEECDQMIRRYLEDEGTAHEPYELARRESFSPLRDMARELRRRLPRVKS